MHNDTTILVVSPSGISYLDHDRVVLKLKFKLTICKQAQMVCVVYVLYHELYNGNRYTRMELY